MVDSVSTNLISQASNIKGNGVWVKPNDENSLVKKQNKAPQQQEVASSAVSKASAAYVSPLLNQKMPATSEEYINKLKNSGKVEGKDFKINKDDKYVDVEELNEKGDVVKGLAWKIVDGKEEPLGTDIFNYRPDGKILYREAKDANGKLEFLAHHYYNNEVPQDIISHDGLTFETKVEDYIKELQAKGVKYTEQIEKDSQGNGTSHIVEEYTPDGKQTMKTVWVDMPEKPELNHVYRDLYKADGNVSTSVLLDEEKSVVVNFFKKMEK